MRPGPYVPFSSVITRPGPSRTVIVASGAAATRGFRSGSRQDHDQRPAENEHASHGPRSPTRALDNSRDPFHRAAIPLQAHILTVEFAQGERKSLDAKLLDNEKQIFA